MAVVIKAIGVLIICCGAAYVTKPQIIKSLMQFFIHGKRLYLAALLRLTLAVVFFSSYRDCDQRWIIFAFGILFLASGLSIFAIGPKKFKPWIEWWLKQPQLLLRILASVTIAVGAIILYAA